MTRLNLSLSVGLLGSFLGISSAHADIPAFYAGTPYNGVAQQIPGRVELADMDLGGINVAWYADHHRMNSEGYQPLSGNDYRPNDQNLPNICKTNRRLETMLAGLPDEANSSEDFWEDGTRYPSEAEPYAYYMGYAHTVDWVRVTVDVQQAGVYNVSSNWACANVNCGCSIWFNDGSDPLGPDNGINKSGVVPLDGTNDYHKWRAYPNFAKVDLSAGLQVMTFHIERGDHLQYGFLQFDPVGGYPDAGAGGSGGTDEGGAGGEAGADTGGAGGTSSEGGAAGSDVGSDGAQAGGEAGSSTTAGSAGTAAAAGGAAGADNTDDSNSSSDSGCAFAPSQNSSQSTLLAGLLMLGATLVRRRRH